MRIGWHCLPEGLRSKNCRHTKHDAVRVKLGFDSRQMPALVTGNVKTEAV